MEPIFTTDWFSPHIPHWERLIVPHFAGKTHLNFLEIGSFEGRSACWLLQNILTDASSRITCIDHFSLTGEEGEEHRDILAHLPLLHFPHDLPINDHFDHNIRAIGAEPKVIKLSGASAEILRTLPLNAYDFLYIDGSHRAPNVLKDIILGWDLLKDGGLMILDDYLWNCFPDEPLKNPRPAIDAFMAVFDGEYGIIQKQYQVMLQKLPAPVPAAALCT